MTEMDNMPDPELTPEQKELVSTLSQKDIELIDKALLSNSCKFWRKVARIVGATMSEIPHRVEGIPDVFYASRIQFLVQEGKLKSQGDLNKMRFCEVKLPGEEAMHV